MTWFKVDDNLAFHHKAMAAGNAAIGMWVRAGSFSAQQLTDGFVPDHTVPSLGSRALATKLVAAGLWTKVRGGFLFHEWEQYQPTKAEVERKRAEARDRMNRVRSTTSGSRSVRANTEGTSDSVTSTPSRPVPSHAAAAASGAAGGGKLHLDDLPDVLTVLRSEFSEFTVLEHVSFAGLKPDQAQQFVTLIHRHGDTRLIDVAKATKRNAAFVQAFLDDWNGLGTLRTVNPDQPHCPICSRTITACKKANTKLAPEDQCEGTAA